MSKPEKKELSSIKGIYGQALRTSRRDTALRNATISDYDRWLKSEECLREIKKVLQTATVGYYHTIGERGKSIPEPKPLRLSDYRVDLGGIFKLAHAISKGLSGGGK